MKILKVDMKRNVKNSELGYVSPINLVEYNKNNLEETIENIDENYTDKLLYTYFKFRKGDLYTKDKLREVIEALFFEKELSTRTKEVVEEYTDDFINLLKVEHNDIFLEFKEFFENPKENFEIIVEKIRIKKDNFFKYVKKSIQNNKIHFYIENGKFIFTNQKYKFFQHIFDHCKDNNITVKKYITTLVNKFDLSECLDLIITNDFYDQEYKNAIREFRVINLKKLDNDLDKTILKIIVEKLKKVCKIQYKNENNIKYEYNFFSEDYAIEEVIKSIQNSYTDFLIKIGKIIFNYTDSFNKSDDKTSFNSSQMIEINKYETLSRTILNKTPNAMFSFRNIVDYHGEEDILSKTIFEDVLKNNLNETNSIRNLKLIFNSQEQKVILDSLKKDELKELLNIQKQSIDQLKNKLVYSTNLKDNFTSQDNQIQFMKNKTIKQLFEEELDINNLKSLTLNLYNSCKIFKFFTIEQLNSISESIKVNLEQFNIKHIPSYKKVLDKGRNIGMFRMYNTLEKKKHLKSNKAKFLTYKNIIRLIYKNFLCEFLNERNVDEFYYIVNKTLSEKVNRGRESNDKPIFNRYNKIEKFKGNIKEYLDRLQTFIYYEALENDKKKIRKKYIYNDFCLDLFSYGFEEYLINNNIYDIIDKIRINHNMNSIEKLRIPVVKKDIDVSEINLRFYTFIKLLTEKTLIELKSELIRYKNQNCSDQKQLEDMIYLIEITILSTYVKSKNYKDYFNSKEDFDNFLNNFFEKECIDNKYYYDKKNNPIINKNIVEVKKYSCFSFVNKILEDNKIELKRINQYINYKDKILKVHKDKLTIHSKISVSSFSSAKDIKIYEELIKIIKLYDSIVNKVELNDILFIQSVIVKLNNKALTSASIGERNMYYTLSALAYLDNDSKFDVKKLLENNNFMEKITKHNCYNEYVKTYEEGFMEKIIDSRNKYNRFMPIKYTNLNCEELIDELRYIHKYNRSLKNSVVKSFNKLLHNNSIKSNISLSSDKEIEIKIESAKELHLKNKLKFNQITKQNLNLIKKIII